MRKAIYILLLTISSGLVMSSCTEEVIKPVTQDNGSSSGNSGSGSGAGGSTGQL